MSFRPLWASLELPKALRKVSERPPGTRLETRRDPEPSPKRNPSFSYGKTTHLEDQNCHLGATNKPQPPPPVELSFDNAPDTSSVKGPTRRHPGSADSEGLRPHAPTLGKRSQPNVFFPHNSKLLPNRKLQIKGPDSKLQTQMPNSQLKTQTEVLLFICSVIGCNNLLKNSSSGTEQQGLWLQSAYLSRSTRQQPLLKRSLQSYNALAPHFFSTKPRTGSK